MKDTRSERVRKFQEAVDLIIEEHGPFTKEEFIQIMNFVKFFKVQRVEKEFDQMTRGNFRTVNR